MIDIAFLLDSSGSIGPHNWEHVIEYLSNITASITATDKRVAIITFGTLASVYLNFTDNQDQLEQVIDTLPYSSDYTNTADALCQLLYQDWRDGVLSIAIVMTDGRSNQRSPTCGNIDTTIRKVKEMRPFITFQVIGVGNNVDNQELKEIASAEELIYHIDGLDRDEEIRELEHQQSYEICYTGE